MPRRLFFMICFSVLTPLVSLGADPQPALSPQQADADFRNQGEYVATIGGDDTPTKVGIQIIALGNGKFHAVGFPGGLPGDGWTGNDKPEADGELKDGVVIFKSSEASAEIRDGVMTLRDPGGNMIGECKKVSRQSPTMNLKAPAGTVILFDGTTADKFNGGKLDGDLLVQGVTSKQKFQNFSMHLEFMLSYMPTKRGQERGNSGCYSQGRYEVQILDSFGLTGENNECGGIYSVKKPDVNMCFPPLSWQTYDIDFTAAKYDGEKKTADARMTVKHNGVVVHNDVAVPKATTAAPVAEGKEPGPLYIQDHSCPIRFRNIWIVEK